LVVEDDPLVRRLNAEVLTSAGYQVDTVVDGADAWDAVQLGCYHLMVTDNDMPRVTGLELIKKIQDARMALPVIMATGNFPGAEFSRYTLLQPVAILLKPYTFDELVTAVQGALCSPADDGGEIVSPRDFECQPRSVEARL
jgi:DNA-binding response OmpR family regulator